MVVGPINVTGSGPPCRPAIIMIMKLMFIDVDFKAFDDGFGCAYPAGRPGRLAI